MQKSQAADKNMLLVHRYLPGNVAVLVCEGQAFWGSEVSMPDKYASVIKGLPMKSFYAVDLHAILFRPKGDGKHCWETICGEGMARTKLRR